MKFCIMKKLRDGILQLIEISALNANRVNKEEKYARKSIHVELC